MSVLKSKGRRGGIKPLQRMELEAKAGAALELLQSSGLGQVIVVAVDQEGTGEVLCCPKTNLPPDAAERAIEALQGWPS